MPTSHGTGIGTLVMLEGCCLLDKSLRLEANFTTEVLPINQSITPMSPVCQSLCWVTWAHHSSSFPSPGKCTPLLSTHPPDLAILLPAPGWETSGNFKVEPEENRDLSWCEAKHHSHTPSRVNECSSGPGVVNQIFGLPGILSSSRPEWKQDN